MSVSDSAVQQYWLQVLYETLIAIVIKNPMPAMGKASHANKGLNAYLTAHLFVDARSVVRPF